MTARRLVYLVEASPIDDLGVVQVQRWSAGERNLYTYNGKRWMSCVANAPGSTGPFTYTAGFPLGSTQGVGGSARAGFGSLTLIRHKRGAPRRLEHLIDLHFDGRSIKIWRGLEGDAFANFTLLLDGIMGEKPTFASSEITIPLRDLATVIDVPAQEHTYAGTNGLEGPPEKKGIRKPWVLGRVYNMEPEVLDHAAPGPTGGTYSRVVQISDGVLALVPLITPYERARPFDASKVHSVVDVYAWPPVEGHVAIDINGYARFGSIPEGVTTFDVAADMLGTTHGDLVLALLLRTGRVVPDDIDQPAMNDFITVQQPVPQTSLLIRDDRTIAAYIDLLAQSCGSYWTFTPRRKFRMRKIGWSTSKGLITPAKTVTIRPQTPEVPVWRLRFGFLPMERVLSDTDIGGAVVLPDVRQLRSRAFEYRVQEYQPARDRHPLAKELQVDSRFTITNSAATEAARQAALLRYTRQPFVVTVRAPFETFDIGDTWTLQHPDYGLAAGRDFIVKEKTERPAYQRDQDMVELTLFGPRAVGE